MHTSSGFLSLYPLRLPRRLYAAIRKGEAAARALPREDLSPAALWLEDHARFLAEEAQALGRQLRKRPRLPGREGTPRILLLARYICSREQPLTEGLILSCARAFLDGQEITARELHYLPAALTLALMEELKAIISLCIRETRVFHQADRWAREMIAGKSDSLPPEEGMAAAVLSRLSHLQDRGEAVLENIALPEGIIPHSSAQEEESARQGMAAERIIQGIRRIKEIPFHRIADRLSPVSAILRKEETYRRMDDTGRMLYISRVCRIAKKLHMQESAVARAALALAQGKEGAEGEAGYYLLHHPRQIGAYLFQHSPSASHPRHRERLFVAALFCGCLLFAAIGLMLALPWYLFPALLLCSSEITRILLFAWVRRHTVPGVLPRIRIRSLCRKTRTLVVVPTLLSSPKQSLQMARQLSVLQHANTDPFLDFMLLGDFADAPHQQMEGDREIIDTAAEAIRALNQSGNGGFFYLHRERSWEEGQQAFCGRERKRGALESLNRLIVQGRSDDTFCYSSCDLAVLHRRYAYVITLDADTFLPPGAAHQLVGAMEHPLQKGHVGVIQPRMEIKPDTVRTRIQLFLGGRGSTDVYGLAAQDVYQDLFGRGSYVGKGIYQPDLFLARLEGKLPKGRLLSHDLIEGEFAFSALASDIVLYDGHPGRLSGWQKRLHRWTRGDWQLLPFLLDKKLSLLSRLKIGDNLRRSLLPLAQIALMLSGTAAGHPLICLMGLPFPIRGMGRRLLLLPAKAYTLLDAILRSLYRQFVSHKKLMSWVTAAQAENGGGPSLSCQLAQVFVGAALSLFALLPGGFLPMVFPAIAWVISPLFASFLDGPIRGELPFTPAQRENVRKLALATWHFFEDAVGPDTLHLPPDNIQLDPFKGPAMRTSPTNMGLYLLSCAAALEMGFITHAQMAERMDHTLNTMETMEKWHGHFYNWYDLHTGAPLPPRFISTVDSGNLAGCLFACAQLCRKRLSHLPDLYRNLPSRLDALFYAMEFAPLYDRKRDLFHIGYDADHRRLTPAHYDLMASEARITSYVAVMTKQVPIRHFAALNRKTVQAGGGPALLSWGGTMFEYLMPALLLPHLPGTLLGESCKNAIRAQMSIPPHLPFGVSESGYWAFDPDMNYQYRAFGLPVLAQSGETEGQVIAPYASMLALPFFPRAAAANLHKMQRLGWQDEHGLYEAADYTPQQMDGTPRLVKSHMAHHQGMILCAACNALTKGSLIRAFMAPPIAQAHALLLMESPPRRASRRPDFLSPREDSLLPRQLGRRPKSALPPEAHLLRGGSLTWLADVHGQGYLQSGEMMITRFQGEAGSQTGPQFYLKDEDTGALCRPAADGKAWFDAGSVCYTLDFQGLQTTLQYCVSPLSGVAIAALTVENPTGTDRNIQAASFLEIAQGPQAADEAHPNFRDLSVQVHPFGEKGIMALRLPREAGEEIPPILHGLSGDCAWLRLQGNRLAFLGREGSYAAPRQLTHSPADWEQPLGDVIAPCLSLHAGMHIAAHSHACLYFQTAIYTEKISTCFPMPPEMARSAFRLSDTQARMSLRFLHMDEHLLHLSQQMLGSLAFWGLPHQCLLPSAPQNALWKWGISGTLPVMMLILTGEGEKGRISQLLKIHQWLTLQGMSSDLIILIRDEEGYQQPLRDLATRMITLSHARDTLGKPGGVHLINGDEQEQRALESLSCLVLRDGKPLAQQLKALRHSLASPPPSLPTRAAAVQPPVLDQFNSFGGFTQEGAYCILAPSPAPWHNILCNAHFGTLVSEGAILHSYSENSRLRRVTRPAPDVHRAPPSENIWLQAEGRAPFSLIGCTACHEPGVTAYSREEGSIQTQTHIFAHPHLPLTLRMIQLRSPNPCKACLSWLIRFHLGERPRDTRCQAEGDSITARSGEFSGYAWAMLSDASAQCITTASHPGKMEALPPPSPGAPLPGPGTIGLLTLEIVLRPRETCTLICALGSAQEEGSHRDMYAALLGEGGAPLLRQVRAKWNETLGGITLYSANDTFNRMINIWLPYQTRAARLLARTGPYQAGGAFGFRDQLQDLLCLLHTDPAFAREHILLCAAHQFMEGDVQHWWHAPRQGVRTRISDDKLFLPYLTALYVRITGDESILTEEIAYLASAPLSPEEDDRYESPEVTEEKESLLLHCIRAVESVNLGVHDVPLMGGGDWNDGMNRVGGKNGESVWLGFFLALVIQEFFFLLPPDKKESFSALRRRVLDGCGQAWTGKWYLRAWYDSGEPMGGPDTHPPRIDLISQCFAVLAGAPRDQGRTALKYAVQLLYDRPSGTVRLLAPPFTPQEQAGYIGAYLPGIRENGGQYTHAAPWLVMALCKIGEYPLAWEIARALLPPLHGDTKEKALRYRTEPYVLCGDVYAGQHTGRGGWSWYTGSAAWLYFTVITQLLGFEKQGNRARLSPCPDPEGEEYTLVYRFGSAAYHFTAARDAVFPTLDGERISDGWTILQDDGKTHEARYPLRTSHL